MSGAEEAGAAEGPAPAQDLYREKPVSKVVRVMTVMAYLTSVSFAAILLSVYYICIWKSPEAPRGDDPGYLLARQGSRADYQPAYFAADDPRNLTGRGGPAVSGASDNGTDAPADRNYTNAGLTDAPDDAATPTADATAPDDTPTPDAAASDDTPTPDPAAPDETLPPDGAPTPEGLTAPANLTADT